ncbi:uncharacterized protein LOC130084978 [Rhinichthys klamathensis goyatoka]|uniref:uncharacterized protein LOC130084978 n=1 Tax=Rhinichthys klamathensis goyatoka TaxID=3034132 RepID=UPI0024B5510C|nr:uncharacterized protein LOC130084978 [Rhinichthys klamathensis goyatoka]
MVLRHRITLLLLISSCLIVLTDSCNNRCLANIIIAKKLKSAPQGNDCSVNVTITSMKYETMSFDTKNMQMSSRVKVNMVWRDLELQWNATTSNASAVMLPVDKIWTPALVLDNAIDVTVKPYTDDVQVSQEGTVDYAVILFISVSCNDINLFNYPFVSGECSVAINGWNQSKCEINLNHPSNISNVGGIQGEWETVNVIIKQDQTFQNSRYLSVSLSISPFSAVVTLILPSVLIMLADLVTFSLPVQGGERNNLKVTLVLSFTMFLLILNDHLSSGGRCSPILHYHFCFCLVNLVLSMVVSIVLTRLTLNDGILSCKCSKNIKKNKKTASLGQDEDAVVIATIKSSDLPSEVASLQKIVNFLENVDQKQQVASSNESFVDRLDKICFCFFLFLDIIYIIVVVIVTRTDLCKEKKKELWDTEDFYDSFSYFPASSLAHTCTSFTITRIIICLESFIPQYAVPQSDLYVKPVQPYLHPDLHVMPVQPYLHVMPVQPELHVMPVQPYLHVMPDQPDLHVMSVQPDLHVMPDQPDLHVMPDQPVLHPDLHVMPDQPDLHVMPVQPYLHVKPDQPDLHVMPVQPDLHVMPDQPDLHFPASSLAHTCTSFTITRTCQQSSSSLTVFNCCLHCLPMQMLPFTSILPNHHQDGTFPFILPNHHQDGTFPSILPITTTRMVPYLPPGGRLRPRLHLRRDMQIRLTSL